MPYHQALRAILYRDLVPSIIHPCRLSLKALWLLWRRLLRLGCLSLKALWLLWRELLRLGCLSLKALWLLWRGLLHLGCLSLKALWLLWRGLLHLSSLDRAAWEALWGRSPCLGCLNRGWPQPSDDFPQGVSCREELFKEALIGLAFSFGPLILPLQHLFNLPISYSLVPIL